MAIQSMHKQRSSPLQLFEQNFSPLIDQSKNIIIHYRFCNARTKRKHFNTINIVSVNGCSTPEEFGKRLTGLIEPSLEDLFQWLKGVHQTYWKAHLAYISEKVEKLTCIITDEKFVFQDDESGLIHEHHFKSFNNCKVYGPHQNELHIFRQYIRFKAVKFAEVWLEVLFGTIDSLDLMYELLIGSLETSPGPPPTSVIHNKTGNGIKSDLTVPQLAYFFRILAKTNIIEISARRNNDLINWITENFQSKNREIIKKTSLRNKYFTPDLQALDYWEQKIKEWLTMIRDERSNLLK